MDMPPRGVVTTASTDEALGILGTQLEGLSGQEAAQRLAAYGPNLVSEGGQYPAWRIALDQLASPLIYVLLGAAGVTALLAHYSDTAIILAVVVLNGIIGFVQEYRATRTLEALRKLAPQTATVRRGGSLVQVETEELVPGDIVIVEAGARVAADMRLLRCNEILADESLLTGESLPVGKTDSPLADPGVALAESRNLLFAGSLVVEGRGEAAVFGTGAGSELGRIAQTVSEVERADTPLQQRFHRFANLLTLGVVGLVLVATAIGLLRGMPFLEILLASIALAVSVVPEGLPVVVTVVLSSGARRMAEHKALVRRLAAAETLGSTEVICTDKTGTLTQNHMTLRAVVGGAWHAEVREDAPLSCPDVQIADDTDCPGSETEFLPYLVELLRIAVFCNNAGYTITLQGKPEFTGDPTEIALLEAAAIVAPELLHRRAASPAISEVPFSSNRKFMATVQRGPDDGLHLLAKGAPDVLLQRCDQEWTPEGPRPIRAARWLEIAEALGEGGYRALALAQREWDTSTVGEDEVQGLTLLGLVGLIDPPRGEAAAAVRGCKEAGIRVIMVTGDHPATAQAIAHRVGILDSSGPADGQRVVAGPELAAMPDEQLAAELDEIALFARVTPHDKLRIVESLQGRGLVVAVTGDGVNDAPALRKADIGVAMGKGGTEAAREAAELVLLDDSFASIYEAVKQGRFLFENIRKVVLFLLSSGAAEVTTILGALAVGWPLPLTAAQILWVNLVTDSLQVAALAFEPGEQFILDRPPRGSKVRFFFDRLIAQHTWVTGLVFGLGSLAVFQYGLFGHENLAEARTAAVTAMVMFQMWHALSCRSLVTSVLRIPLFSNRLLLLSVVASVGAQLLLVYWGPMQRLFGTTSLPIEDWSLILGSSLLGVVAMEISKWYGRRRRWHLQ